MYLIEMSFRLCICLIKKGKMRYIETFSFFWLSKCSKDNSITILIIIYC